MFDLNSITKTRRIEAPKILLTGEPKIGKSTFASHAPKPIFIATENGLAGVDADAFPLASSLDDIYAAIGTLLNEDHPFKTCVLDSADWAEPLVQQYVCKAQGWKDIESPGYGRGYVSAAQEWRNILDGLDALRMQRGMGIVLISHVKQQRIESPTHEGFDAWTLKTHSKVSALIEEWADICAFASHRIAIKQTDAGFNKKENKARALGERVLHLDPHPAYPSGNRFGLHDCSLSWAAFSEQLDSIQQAARAA